MARSDVKKQDQSGSSQSRSNSKPKTATTDQLRLAEMMDGSKVDADRLASMVRKVMDVTNASEDKIAAALDDCGYDEEKAIHSLLEASSDDNEWTNVGKGRNKKPMQAGAGPPASMGAAAFSAVEAGGPGRVRNVSGRGGKSADAAPSGFAGQGFGGRDEHGVRGYRGGRNTGRGGVGVRGARQPLASGRAKRAAVVEEGFEMKTDDSSWPAAGSEIEHPAMGAWGAPPAAESAATATAASSSWDATSSKPSVPSGVVPKTLEEEPDRWSTDVNATPRFDRTASGRSGAGIGSWADATVTPSSATASGSGWGEGSTTVQWGDDLGASPVKAAWQEAESKEPSNEWPAAAAAAAAAIAADDAEDSAPSKGVVTWPQPASELSHQAQIESWRDNVDGHADDWNASDDVMQKPVTAIAGLDSDDQPASETGEGKSVVELPITRLEKHHVSFPLGVSEVIATAMFIKRSQVPTQPVEMPPLCPASDSRDYQFGFGLGSTSTSTSMIQDERHEYAPSSHQTLASPMVDAIVSSLDGVALGSTSPNLGAMDVPMATTHHTQISALSHIRPPPGHAPLGASMEPQTMVTERLVADSQASVGANALLSLSSDLLPPQSGAIPIPGAGQPSSAHSTPVGSLGASCPAAYLERTSNVGSDSGVSHQSPLIVGTSPAGQLRTAPSPPLAVHGSAQVTSDVRMSSPSLNARSSPRASPFHSASPPAPIAMPPMQQPQATQLQQKQSDQKAQASKLAQSQQSSTSTGNQSQSHADQDQQQQQHHQQQQQQQHRHQSTGSSHQHQHQHHQHQHQQHHSSHSSHGQTHHQHQHQQTSGQSSSAGGQHHGPTGAPPGMANMPIRMGMKMPHNMMMGHTAPNTFMPNFMGMPVMPGFSGEYDPAQQRNMALPGVREGSANFQGNADGKYGHEGSSSSSSILGTPGGMNFMAQPQPQQMGVYYPSMYMPVMPFPTMYPGYSHHVPKGGFAGGAPGFIPPPGTGYQSYEDVDYKISSYQPSTQGSKGSNTSASYNSSAGGNMGASYNKSHQYDKSSYAGNSSGLFPTPGNPPSQAQAAAFQQLAGAAGATQHPSIMLPGLAGANASAMANPALHSQFHAMEAANAAAAASAQSQQSSGRGGMAATAQIPASGGAGPKHHSHSGAGAGSAGSTSSGMIKGHGFNHSSWQ